MPAPFRQVSREQFVGLLNAYPFKRRINAVHMHHTWRPEHRDYDPSDGHRTIVGMYLHHTRVNGWQDIAQHITIAPDGTIWLGRNWDLPPASAAGHNGNVQAGPFMFEIIGNFDQGHDVLEGEQLRTVIEVIARVQARFSLPAESLHFHNSMSAKSCPGTSVSYEAISAAVAAFKPGASRAASRSTAATDADIAAALRSLGDAAAYTDPADAEIDHASDHAALSRGGSDKLTPEMLARLRPHLVNLTQGRFSTDGEWKTEPADVDAIFDVHLIEALREAKRNQQPLRILFYAHGGLVKESAGLAIAHKHLQFWKDNGIYPINFVWETGLFETLGHILRRSTDGTRGVISGITDPIVEVTARALRGPSIWGGMKLSAERAVEPKGSVHGQGGAHYVAEKLREFCDRAINVEKGALELHAVGHSAGSIFHAHFLKTALELGAPHVKSLHLLAPAVRVDTFKNRTLPLMGNGIDKTTIYTMTKDFERDDNCGGVYRKSLLYLIHYALEPERKAPILGLEQSLRADRDLVAAFGLGGQAASGSVVFSVTPTDTGRSASTSRSHGGFDDDAPTLGSVVRRILGLQDSDPIIPYQTSRSVPAEWTDQVDWPEEALPAAMQSPAPASVAPAPQAGPVATPAPAAGGGRRIALCVGIDDYPTAPLAGCVADSNEWARIFEGLGFEVRKLQNAQATRAAIHDGMQSLLADAREGDVIVVQYAGHGTTLPDLDGDEDEDDTDEALCPHDFASGAFLIDDDIRALFSQLADGVNLTCFFDCCHSGTNTRFAASIGAAAGAAGAVDQRKRFMLATPQMEQMHRQFRAALPPPRAPRSPTMRNVSFAACQDHEVAWESNGHGDFTVRAGRVFAAGIAALTHEEFQRRVAAEFGGAPRQHPRLDCADGAGARLLLQPLGAAVPEPKPTRAAADPRVARLNAALRDAMSIAQTL